MNIFGIFFSVGNIGIKSESIMALTEKKCKPCSGEETPLQGSDVKEFLNKLKDGWKSVDDKKIRNTFYFDDFKQGMDFTNKIAKLAEEEGHHPDICIHYKEVEVEITTHAIGGLTENDFILAAKIDEL
ncbi:MAG: 4a-hydroxytetrahydrobiopterin dehydratase [Prolixibacteraceae bacterium]